jgi:hypothetical protein
MRSYSDMADEDDEAVSRAITAAVMTGLEYVELEGPRPYAEFSDPYEPPLGGRGEPWESKPNAHGDRVEVGAVDGDVSITAVEPDGEHRTAHVHPRDIPAMCRAAYQAAGLPWPGDEVERLRERVRELESATCMPEVMAVVEAWGPHGSAGTLDLDVLGHALDALRDAVRSGKRCGLHPATVELLRAVHECMSDTPRVRTAVIRWREAGCPDLPREGGES